MTCPSSDCGDLNAGGPSLGQALYGLLDHRLPGTKAQCPGSGLHQSASGGPLPLPHFLLCC